MIQSFKHKGLRELFERGKSKRIASDFAPKLVRQMDAINEANARPNTLTFPATICTNSKANARRIDGERRL
jgi:plasmid maintenance system killer protein